MKTSQINVLYHTVWYAILQPACWFCLKPLCTFSRVNLVKTPNIRYFLLSPEESPLTSSSTFYHQVPQMLLLCVSPCLELGCISPGVKGRDQRWPSCSWPENLDQRCGHVEANRRALGWNRAEKTKRERERQTDRQTDRQRSRSVSAWHSASMLRMSMIHQQRPFCCFSHCTQVLHFRLFCWLWGLLHFFWEILAHSTLFTWCEEPTHWKSHWCWENWGQEEKGVTEDKMAGWHHRFNGHEFEQAPGDSEGQRRLSWGCPQGGRESDKT